MKNDIIFEETISDFDNRTRVIKAQQKVIFYFSEDNRLQKFGKFLNNYEKE